MRGHIGKANTELGFYSKNILCYKAWYQHMANDRHEEIEQIYKQKSFKMQGAKDVRAALDYGMHVSVIDISDACFHVSIHKKAGFVP